jgi:cyclopropane-fatty-acyl-phospholipid synthase
MKANLPSELLSLQLPLRIRIGEAQAFDLGPDPEVTLIIRDPTLLADIGQPASMSWGAPMSRSAWTSMVRSAR